MKPGSQVFMKMSLINGSGEMTHKQTILSEGDSPDVVFSLGDESNVSQQKDGILTFRVKIFDHVETKVLPCVPQSTIDSSEELLNNLGGLFENMKFSDVIFNVRDRLVPAHKSILAARSKVFEAMFQHPFEEKTSNQVKIEDIDPDVFHELLRFIYTGRMALTKMEVMADGLLMAADKYLVDGLKTKWESYLVLHLSPVNCLRLLLHGDLLNKNPTETLEKAAKFFRRHQCQVIATAEWKKAKENNPSLLCDIQEFVYRYE